MTNKNNDIKMTYRISEQLFNDLKEYQKSNHIKISPIIRGYLKSLVSKNLASNDGIRIE